jgi:hypothetical protein
MFEYLLVQEAAADEGSNLVLYFTPFDPNAAQLSLPENATRRVLISGLQGMEFSYFGNKQDRETRAWHKDWETASIRYPDLIRLSLRYTIEDDGVRERYIRIRQNYPMVVQRQ